jgi:anthranilate 1,2-dioxygenase small subunit
MTGSIPAAQLRGRLRDFYEDYAACLDDRDFVRWPEFFTEDARYRVQPAENYKRGLPHAPIYCEGKGMLHDRVSATSVLVIEPRRQQRMVSNVRIRSVEGSSIKAQAGFILIENYHDRDPVLALTGRYIDEILCDGETLLIKDRTCVYENYRIVQNLMFPV